MDGSPHCIAVKLLESTYICSVCSSQSTGLECCTYYGNEWDRHIKNAHNGQKIKKVLEFDWVVLRIGPLHVKMSMLKTFFAVNWEVFISALASEMGFTTEKAQKYVKSMPKP